MADDKDEALQIGADDEVEESEDGAAEPGLEDIPASLMTGDDGEPLEEVDDDAAILSEGFSTDEDPESEDPDAYLYKAPTVSFADSAEEDAVADWPEEE